MSDIFREVDEDVRSKEVEDLVRRYGPFLAVAALLLVGLYGGYTFWQNYQNEQRGQAGDQLIAGMEALDNGDQALALETFSSLAESGPAGYQLLAGFQLAATQRDTGDLTDALATYDAIAADTAHDVIYRDLARIYGGYIILGLDATNYDQLNTRLGGIASGNSVWRFHALELLGFSALQSGDYELAQEHLTQITDNSAAPAGISRRADELLNVARGATPETAGN